MNELTLAVVGIGYDNADGSNRLFEIKLCRPGDTIELRPEPGNEHDPRAVAVWRNGGGQLGYLTAERAGWIGQRLQAEECIVAFQGLAENAAYVRARFGGGAPSLPADRQGEPAASIDDTDFYADPDGPEFGA